MSDRKKDHINLAFQAQIKKTDKDLRFIYEPMLDVGVKELEPINFLEKELRAPVWISSMTGGTTQAEKINNNLAKLASEFGLGMGLGSCRCLLENDDCLDDFNIRSIVGNALPLYGNLGVGQIEKLVLEKEVYKINKLIEKLKADGLIIHVNPLQEFFQPEGDGLKLAPIETITELLKQANFKIIVKEVGQGMGYESLKALLQLPIAAIDFGAFGGTNFSKLEMMRNNQMMLQSIGELAKIGQTADEMTLDMNKLYDEFPESSSLNVIISGGIKSFLDGYYLINKINYKAIYGQGSTFLAYALHDYEILQKYFSYQLKGLQMAYAYLRVV